MYDDAPLAPAPHLEGDPAGGRLGALREEYVVDQAGTCLICSEIVVRSAWQSFAGWECEMTCLVQHCTVCGLCGRSGLVCRVCGVCVEHEEQGSTLACWTTIWSKARRHEIEFYVHDLWNPATGRWGL